MKRRLISLVLVLMLVMTAGCGKKSTTKKLKTEDLDETTLQQESDKCDESDEEDIEEVSSRWSDHVCEEYQHT